MKVMIDSNVLVSAVYNPNSTPARVVRDVCENHELLLCDYIVAECYDVVGRKFPQHIPVLDKLLASLGYSLVAAPRGGGARIADPKDAPILNAAILENVDVIISGDGHFLKLDMERPKILNPTRYLNTADDAMEPPKKVDEAANALLKAREVMDGATERPNPRGEDDARKLVGETRSEEDGE